MWNQLASYKNHYLQRDIKFIKAEQINQLVAEDYAKKESFKKCSQRSQAKLESSTYFEDHANLAYGFRALPKLLCELGSTTATIRWRAVNSLAEYLMNPLHATKAIYHEDIIRKVYNVWMNLRHNYEAVKCVTKDVESREVASLLRIFYTLSIYLEGARKIVAKPILLNEFYNIIINNEKEYMVIVSKILRNLSEKTEIVLYMLDKTKALEKLKRIFLYDPELPHYDECLWLHLSHFLEIAPQKGIEYGFLEVFEVRIKQRVPRYHDLNMKCLALLLTCDGGQKRFDNLDLMRTIHEIFKDTHGGLDTYEYVLLALMNGLNSKRALWRCHEFTDFPLHVMECTKIRTRQTVNLQLYVLQVIKHMSVMPCIKSFILKRCLVSIKHMKCLSERNECIKNELVKLLNRQGLDSCPLPRAFTDETESLYLSQNKQYL